MSNFTKMGNFPSRVKMMKNKTFFFCFNKIAVLNGKLYFFFESVIAQNHIISFGGAEDSENSRITFFSTCKYLVRIFLVSTSLVIKQNSIIFECIM